MPSQPTKLAVGLLAACCLCIGTAAPAALADDTDAARTPDANAVAIDTAKNDLAELLGILGDGIKDGKVVLPQNGQIQLKPHILPENATNKTPAWNSSNNDVITVSPDGLVIAHKAGNATVTLTVDGKKANVDVTVKPLVEFVKIGGKNVADGNLKRLFSS